MSQHTIKVYKIRRHFEFNCWQTEILSAVCISQKRICNTIDSHSFRAIFIKLKKKKNYQINLLQLFHFIISILTS